MVIDVNVSGQSIKLANNVQLVSGSQEFVSLAFHLSSDWDKLTAFCQFQQNGNSYNVFLDSENSVFLPTEISGGYCDIMLYGTSGSIIATTGVLRLKIADSTIEANAASTAITEDLYAQLADKVNDLSDKYQEVKKTALGAVQSAKDAASAAQNSGRDAVQMMEESVNNAAESAAVSERKARTAAEMAAASADSAAAVQNNVQRATDILNDMVAEHGTNVFEEKVTMPSLQLGNTEISETQLQQLLALLNN